MGCCFSGPVVMRPWDSLEGTVSAGGYYGAQAHGFHPLHGAPVTEPSGGILYFDSGANHEDILTALSLMHAPLQLKDYAVFVSVAEDVEREGYLTHCRIMPLAAVVHFFGATINSGFNGPQPVTVEDFIRGFVSLNEAHYGTGMSSKLYGAMGGDGDWAKESLCFGFMIENEYHRICRIWSRAWLVTK